MFRTKQMRQVIVPSIHSTFMFTYSLYTSKHVAGGVRRENWHASSEPNKLDMQDNYKRKREAVRDRDREVYNAVEAMMSVSKATIHTTETTTTPTQGHISA